MSTLAAAATLPTTQAAENGGAGSLVFWAIVAALSLAGVVVAIVRFGILRPSNIAGPARITPPLAVWPLWVSFGMAIVSFVFASLIAASLMHQNVTRSAPDAPLQFSDRDLAISAVVPNLMAFSLVAVFLAFLQPGTLRGLGFSPRSLGRGVTLGILAGCLIIPSMFIAGLVTEIIYHGVGFQHPTEHDLLRVMLSRDALVKWMAIAGAVIVAPLWEEFIFRGLLQTALTEGLMRLARPVLGTPMAPAGFEMIPLAEISQTVSRPPLPPPDNGTSAPAAAPPMPAGVPLPVSPLPPQRRHRYAWISVVLSAALFTFIHASWTWPEIFLLAIAMGYVYERTGKLWASITIHAMFNMISTVLYLSQF
jgi:membrane protease YdiL (CAAX protease family)